MNVTNPPSRPAPMLATITSLSALSGGQIVLGIGAGPLGRDRQTGRAAAGTRSRRARD
jgi:alkanesulfonate monooxygenase SsuD/methylene tetrahydromethanopterin reductase-like flavin-dependent oxidoreductase (luciferase family)